VIPRNTIIQGHVMDILKRLPDESIDMCVTSPPYWKLRQYGTEKQVWGGNSNCNHQWPESGAAVCGNCSAWYGELGQEPDYRDYIRHLGDTFDEVERVLKPHGTLWVNLGDSYSGSRARDLSPKSLVLIPSRFAIEMTDQRDWIARSDLIWHKTNPVPCSAKDRFAPSHEYVFLFAKSEHYYFQMVYEPWKSGEKDKQRAIAKTPFRTKLYQNVGAALTQPRIVGNPFIGRHKRSVMPVAKGCLAEAHFAAFPQDLVKPLIQAGCPEHLCKNCKKPRERLFVESKPVYTDCGCNAGFEPGIVLDIFIGTGTTALAALELNRSFLGIELNPDYVAMANKRIEECRSS
jgi:DNA modification methylase